MNLPLSNAVNPALASALLTVSSPAHASSATSTSGSAASLREDFAQHFARMARQNQARPLAPQPAPERQHLATDAQHRPDARFAAIKQRAPAALNAPQKEVKGSGNVANEDRGSVASDEKSSPKAEAKPLDKDGADIAAESSASTDTHTDHSAETKPEEALPAGTDAAWAGLVPDGLKTLQISERLQIITSSVPMPDPQSNAQFARGMGFDEQMIQRLFGPAPAGAAGAAAALVATPGLIPQGGLVSALGQPPSFTVSADAAKAMASLGAASATNPGQGLSTVGELQNLGVQSIHISEMVNADGGASLQANLATPSVSTQNVLAMLSAFVPNADSKRLTSDNNTLDTIDLTDLVSDSPGSALNLGNPSAVRSNPMGSTTNPNLAPTSSDMAQAFQDLSDKLSTELAGRMHQQLNEGQWKMKLGLKPSHLGAVDVELEMRDGKLSAVINADNATTQQLLNQGSPRLREALNALGWDQASVNIGQGHSSSAQSGQGQGQHTGKNGQNLSRSESIQGDGSDAMPNKTQNASNALLDIYA